MTSLGIKGLCSETAGGEGMVQSIPARVPNPRPVVQWAIDTRSDWAKDLIVVPNLEATHLEPTHT